MRPSHHYSYAAVAMLAVIPACEADKATDPAGYYGLPTGAANVVDLGNGWHTFELTDRGAKRTFLHQWRTTGNSSTEVLTELSPQGGR